jgi:hypothetical protein
MLTQSSAGFNLADLSKLMKRKLDDPVTSHAKATKTKKVAGMNSGPALAPSSLMLSNKSGLTGAHLKDSISDENTDQVCNHREKPSVWHAMLTLSFPKVSLIEIRI